jgi:hypothetical protein
MERLRNPVLSYPNRSSSTAAGLHPKNLASDVFLRQSPKEIRAESLNELAGEIRRKTIIAFAQEQI